VRGEEAKLSGALKAGNRRLELLHGTKVSDGLVRRAGRRRRSGPLEEEEGSVTQGGLAGPHGLHRPIGQ
jgi:hypothetical protein